MTALNPTVAVTTASTAPVIEDSLDDLEALLNGDILDIEEVTEPEADADEVIEVADDDLADLESAIEREEVKNEIYAEQEAPVATIAPVSAEPVAEATATTEPAKKTRKAPVRTKIDGDALITATKLDTAGTLGEVPKAKKVKEKAVNLLQCVATAGKVHLSNYTQIALKELFTRGSLTCKELTDVLATSYKPGTARAQASQMAVLLPAMKIAVGGSKGMTVNPDSTLVADLKKLVGVA